jgi:hypothetical protein
MKIYGAVGAAGVLAVALAGCSSSSDPSTPAPKALASSIAAQATSPAADGSAADGSASAGSGSAGSGSAGSGSAAAGSESGGSGECSGAVAATRAALAGLAVSSVTLPEGCTVVYIKTPKNDTGLGVQMCEKAAAKVFPLGLVGVAVESDAGDPLAIGAPSQSCRTIS